MRNLTIVILICAGFAFLSGNALATDVNDIPEANPGESLTVFLDISVLSRKRRAAEKINELHAQHAERGWVFADLEIYTENGDLQGYFITYAGRVD